VIHGTNPRKVPFFQSTVSTKKNQDPALIFPRQNPFPSPPPPSDDRHFSKTLLGMSGLYREPNLSRKKLPRHTGVDFSPYKKKHVISLLSLFEDRHSRDRAPPRDVLRAVDVVAAEDTRHTGNLLRHYGIRTPMRAYHARGPGTVFGCQFLD